MNEKLQAKEILSNYFSHKLEACNCDYILPQRKRDFTEVLSLLPSFSLFLFLSFFFVFLKQLY